MGVHRIATLGALALCCACAQGIDAGSRGQTESGFGSGSTGQRDASGDADAGATWQPGGTMSTSTSASSGEDGSSDVSASESSDDGIPYGCGDGVVVPPEACDDGNRTNADGCNRDCTISGTLLWDTTVSGGFGMADQAMGVEAAADGTAFVAGYLEDAEMHRMAWLTRYSEDGEPLWTRSHEGPGPGNNEIRGLLLDEGGTLYAAGYESTEAEGLNAWLRAYNLQGNEVWTRTYNSPANSTDIFQSATFDGSGNLVVAGYHGVTDEGADALLRKYSPEGDVLWTREYSPGNGGADVFWDVALSEAGHLYVAGYETGIVGEARNGLVRKYDTDGNPIWTRTTNGAESLDDFFVGVESIGEDDLVVCGYETSVDYPWHSFVRRYDSLGMIMWTDTYSGEASEGAHCFGAAADSEGNVVVGGGEIVAGIRGVMVRKYTPEGDVLWNRVVPGGDVGPDYARRLAIGPDDEIVASGAMNTGVDDRDIWVGTFAP